MQSYTDQAALYRSLYRAILNFVWNYPEFCTERYNLCKFILKFWAVHSISGSRTLPPGRLCFLKFPCDPIPLKVVILLLTAVVVKGLGAGLYKLSSLVSLLGYSDSCFDFGAAYIFGWSADWDGVLLPGFFRHSGTGVDVCRHAKFCLVVCILNLVVWLIFRHTWRLPRREYFGVSRLPYFLSRGFSLVFYFLYESGIWLTALVYVVYRNVM